MPIRNNQDKHYKSVSLVSKPVDKTSQETTKRKIIDIYQEENVISGVTDDQLTIITLFMK